MTSKIELALMSAAAEINAKYPGKLIIRTKEEAEQQAINKRANHMVKQDVSAIKSRAAYRGLDYLDYVEDSADRGYGQERRMGD